MAPCHQQLTHISVSWGDFPFSSYPKLVSAGQAQRYQS